MPSAMTNNRQSKSTTDRPPPRPAGVLAAGAFATGLGLGLTALLALDGHAWLPLWGLALLGLAWLGWGAEPRLARPLVPPAAPAPAAPRLVRGGRFDMVALPGGEFAMGSPYGDDMARDEEKPQHQVRVSGFCMARTQVTVRVWREIMGGDADIGDPDLPVTDVSWLEAIDFCNRLSRRERLQPCYRRVGFWRWRRWVCDWRANGYRLPTEAEWEYACRAGTDSRYGFGDDPALLGDYAWLDDNSDGRPHPVATKRPNRWGLFDMHGNVWEWCWDWYGAYGQESQIDPRGPKSGWGRVVRGGSFDNSPEDLRSAARDVGHPELRRGLHGFRCARVSPPSIDPSRP